MTDLQSSTALKFAAIDIGSNAVRLLLTRVLEDGQGAFFKKESLIRLPIRLGEEAFTIERFSPGQIEVLVNAMTGFKYMMQAYQPLDYMACATSAMREVKNGPEVVRAIKKECGIDLQIIDGKLEAEIIFANRFEQRLNKQKHYLYIDVGGGSTELTLLAAGRAAAAQSFKIGTVRALKGKVKASTWKSMRLWIKEHTRGYQPLAGIGSGGNINKMFRLARQKEGKPLSYKALGKMDALINSYTFEERIRILNLRPDRADVIVPASRIYLTVMRWAGCKKIYVPQIGLADGLVRMLYERYRKSGSPLV